MAAPAGKPYALTGRSSKGARPQTAGAKPKPSPTPPATPPPTCGSSATPTSGSNPGPPSETPPNRTNPRLVRPLRQRLPPQPDRHRRHRRQRPRPAHRLARPTPQPRHQPPQRQPLPAVPRRRHLRRHPDAYDQAGGFDPRFVGWGGEDTSLGAALTTLVGPPARLEASVWHLWHPGPNRPPSSAAPPAQTSA